MTFATFQIILFGLTVIALITAIWFELRSRAALALGKQMQSLGMVVLAILPTITSNEADSSPLGTASSAIHTAESEE